MIRITPSISIDESEIAETFIRASGPGGQNVNKVESAVQLRFDVRRSPNLPPDVVERLIKLAGRRMTSDGVLVITAQQYRTQDRNRADGMARLIDLIQKASIRPTIRRATRPTLASKKRRLEAKKNRSGVKALRQNRPHDD
jgi:ribosome-associated protein